MVLPEFVVTRHLASIAAGSAFRLPHARRPVGVSRLGVVSEVSAGRARWRWPGPGSWKAWHILPKSISLKRAGSGHWQQATWTGAGAAPPRPGWRTPGHRRLARRSAMRPCPACGRRSRRPGSAPRGRRGPALPMPPLAAQVACLNCRPPEKPLPVLAAQLPPDSHLRDRVPVHTAVRAGISAAQDESEQGQRSGDGYQGDDPAQGAHGVPFPDEGRMACGCDVNRTV